MPDAGCLGDYRLLHRLAVGGQGEVFLARQRGRAGFDRLAVVKRLLPDVSESEEHLALFLDEARISAHLTHPNIVSIYELGESNGEYFLSMEYVAGQNLGRLLMRTSQTHTRIPLELAAYVVHELAVALEYAHHAGDADGIPLGIIHRDISPSNALISYRGDVKLMDFGIAKAANRESVSRTGVLRGKFPYMSPEQVRGQKLDARSDLFSLGVVLWETTLGRRLFKGASDLETLKLVEFGKIVSPVEIDPAYPPALAEVVMAALARDRDQRTPRAGDIAAGLRAWLGEQIADAPARLGALMCRTFANESAEQDRIVRAAMTPTPAQGSPTAPDPDPTTPTPSNEQPTTPLGVALPATVQLAKTAPAPALVAAPAYSRRKIAGIALLIAVASAASSYVIWRQGSTPSAVAPADGSQMATALTAAVDAATEAPTMAPFDAASAALEAMSERSAVLDAAMADAPRTRPHIPRDATVATPAVQDAAPLPADARAVGVEPALAVGTLAIAPQPDSELMIDGAAYDGGSSYERQVKVGPHEVLITNLRTRKVYRAHAEVRAGSRTKCRIDQDDELRCR